MSRADDLLLSNVCIKTNYEDYEMFLIDSVGFDFYPFFLSVYLLFISLFVNKIHIMLFMCP